jgi:glycosyltransferase involved in cell wall biosynthesis
MAVVIFMKDNLIRENKRKKKIIFYSNTISIGGAEKYLEILALHLNSENFNVKFAIPKSKGTEDFVNELKSKGIQVDFIKRFNILNILLYFRKNEPDYIHFNLPYPTECVIAILAGIIHAKSKIFLTEHLVLPKYKLRPFVKLIKKFIYAKIDKSITVSNTNKKVLIENFNLPENKIKVIYNCVDIEYIMNYNKEVVRDLKNKFEINDSAIVFGTVGRLDKQKGHQYLIDASKNVIEKVPNSLFLFLGMGKFRNQLIQKIKDNNMTEYFRLVGYQENLPEILALIDVFVLPSISEGLPFSVLEAMAAGKPVIATNVGGTPEIITNNVNGILVEPKDSDALSKALILFATDARKKKYIAEMGHKRILENFSLEKMISATEEIYK